VSIAVTNPLINPQLCKTFDQEKFDWTGKELIAEPKYDGLRAIVVVDNGKAEAFSRNGKPLYNVDHILEELEQRFTDITGSWVFDGEFYTKDWNLSMGIVKSSVTKHAQSKEVRYHVWDLLTLEEWKDGKSITTLDIRFATLQLMIELFDTQYTHCVEQVRVSNLDQARTAFCSYLDKGYEGIILKDPKSEYELGKRSKGWMKWKPLFDADLMVIEAYEGNGKHAGRLGKVLLTGQAEWKSNTYEVTTECGTGFNDEERERYWKLWKQGELTGKIFEIQFQDITNDNAMRFPVFHRERSDRE
jgi:ATP-dependent DNA ligase